MKKLIILLILLSYIDVLSQSDSNKISKSVEFEKENQKKGTIEFILPLAKKTIKAGDNINVIWKLDSIANVYSDMLALIILNYEYGFKSDTLKTVNLSSKSFEWKVPDTLNKNLVCKIKIVPAMTKFVNPAESEIFILDGVNEYIKNRFTVSTGINFNYAADPKFSGLYFGISASFPNLTRGFLGAKYLGIDLYLAQGLVQYNENSNDSSNNSKFSLVQTLKNTNVYPSASVVLSYTNNLQFVIAHAEFNKSSKTLSSDSSFEYSRTIRINNERDSVILVSTKKNYTKNAIYNNFFLGAGGGFTFFNSSISANVKIIPGYNFYTEHWGMVVRYFLKYSKSPSISIGGTITSNFSDQSYSNLWNLFNNNSTEAMVYAAVDIDLGSILNIALGIK